MEKTLYPIVLFAQVIPKIAIAPLLVVWFGFGLTPKIILAVLIAFFPVVDLRCGRPALDRPGAAGAVRHHGRGRWQTFRKIRFPNALPHLMAGLKVAVTLAVVGAVVGEFVGANEGLGYVFLHGQRKPRLGDAVRRAVPHVAHRHPAVRRCVEVAEALLIPWHASRRAGQPPSPPPDAKRHDQ